MNPKNLEGKTLLQQKDIYEVELIADYEMNYGVPDMWSTKVQTEFNRKFDEIQTEFILKETLELFKEMEWRGTHTDYEDSWAVMTYACPCCRNARTDGHKFDCKLSRLVHQIEGICKREELQT